MEFVCPDCDVINIGVDAAEGYCCWCHWQTGDREYVELHGANPDPKPPPPFHKTAQYRDAPQWQKAAWSTRPFGALDELRQA